jgi:hypothetical protein
VKQQTIATVFETQFQNDVGIQGRLLNAQATLSGNPADALNAALYTFDNATARTQRQQLSDNLTGLWGDAFKTTQGFANEMAALDKTLAAERLVIVKQGNDAILQAQKQASDQAQQNASALVTSLTDYARKLQIGQDSPLSPQAQYDLASRQFNAVAGAAQAGNFASMQQLTSFADALLQTSRTVFGSGIGFAQDNERVLNVIQSISDMTDSQLTADAMAQIAETQTQTIVDNLAQLRTVMQQVLAQLRTNGSRPAALAA